MLEINHDLRDIVISAFRYALGRKTYITLTTCDYIKDHSELVDKRVKDVLLRDLENLDMYYSESDMDYEVFKEFEKWLSGLVVE